MRKKQPVTLEVYLDGKLHNVVQENRVVYSNAAGQLYVVSMGRRRLVDSRNCYQEHIRTIQRA